MKIESASLAHLNHTLFKAVMVMTKEALVLTATYTAIPKAKT